MNLKEWNKMSYAEKVNIFFNYLKGGEKEKCLIKAYNYK